MINPYHLTGACIFGPFSGHPHLMKVCKHSTNFGDVSCMVWTWTPSVIEHFLGSHAEIGNATINLQPFLRGCSLCFACETTIAISWSERDAQDFHISTVICAIWLIFGCIYIVFSSPPSRSSSCLGGSYGIDGHIPYASSLSRFAAAWLASILAQYWMMDFFSSLGIRNRVRRDCGCCCCRVATL